MIRSFGDAVTEDFYNGVSSARARRSPASIASSARRKLDQLANAVALNDLASPPGNALEALKGDLAGFYSIRINDQWRVVFRWSDGGAEGVSIDDYHWEDKPMLPTHRVTTHPGEMLLEEYLKSLGLSVTKFSEAIGVSRVRLSEIVNGRRGVTADTALRLAKALGTTPEFWLNLQASYDLTSARSRTKLGRVRVVNPAVGNDKTGRSKSAR